LRINLFLFGESVFILRLLVVLIVLKDVNCVIVSFHLTLGRIVSEIVFVEVRISKFRIEFEFSWTVLQSVLVRGSHFAFEGHNWLCVAVVAVEYVAVGCMLVDLLLLALELAAWSGLIEPVV